MLHRIEDEVFRKLDDSIQELQEKLFKSMLNMTDASTCTASSLCSESLTKEKLISVMEQLKPINDYRTNLYLNYIPKYEFKFEEPADYDTFKLLSRYGMSVCKPTRIITTMVQKRTHKCKRINKKWAKRYGYKIVEKEVSDYGFINCRA